MDGWVGVSPSSQALEYRVNDRVILSPPSKSQARKNPKPATHCPAGLTHHAISDVDVQCTLFLQHGQHRAQEISRDGQLGVGVVTHGGKFWHLWPGQHSWPPQGVVNEVTSCLPN